MLWQENKLTQKIDLFGKKNILQEALLPTTVLKHVTLHRFEFFCEIGGDAKFTRFFKDSCAE